MVVKTVQRIRNRVLGKDIMTVKNHAVNNTVILKSEGNSTAQHAYDGFLMIIAFKYHMKLRFMEIPHQIMIIYYTLNITLKKDPQHRQNRGLLSFSFFNWKQRDYTC